MVVAALFVPLQVLPSIHHAVGSNLGSRTAAWLYDRLTTACVRPPGMGHLESPKLTSDLTMARDFDLGISGPPMSISMDFIASGLVELLTGLASAIVLLGYAWWAPVLLAGSWLATHWLLRESGVWRDRNTEEVRQAQRHADYAYRLAVEPPAAKELRLFGLADWTVERFREHRRRLFELRWQATRLRERPVVWSLILVLTANVLVFWSMANSAADGSLPLDRLVTFAAAAVMTSMIAYGGLSWAIDGAAAPVAAVLRLQTEMEPAGALVRGTKAASGMPGADPVPRSDLRIPGHRRARIEGPGSDHPRRVVARHCGPEWRRQDHTGQVALPALRPSKWLHRDRRRRPSRAGYRCLAVAGRGGISRLHPIRTAAARQRGALGRARRRDPAGPCGRGSDGACRSRHHPGRGYQGGTELSGGQWQRVALARALCAVRTGAGLVLLDEPTSQLDVRGEAEIFDRILAATRHTTTILISHRFSTVRHADRICVLEGGNVVELGTHDELMAAGGRYRTMFDLQASRFGAAGAEDEEGVNYDVLA